MSFLPTGYPIIIVLCGSRLLSCASPLSDWDFYVGSVYRELLFSLKREDKLSLYTKEYHFDIKLHNLPVEVKISPIEKLFMSIAKLSPSALETIIALKNGAFSSTSKINIKPVLDIIQPECLALSTSNYAYSFTKRYMRALEHHEKRAFEAIKLLAIYYYLIELRAIPPPNLRKIVESVDGLNIVVPPYTRTLKEAFLEFIDRRMTGSPIPDWSMSIIFRSASMIHNMMSVQKYELEKNYSDSCKETKNKLIEALGQLYRDILEYVIRDAPKEINGLNMIITEISKIVGIEEYASEEDK